MSRGLAPGPLGKKLQMSETKGAHMWDLRGGWALDCTNCQQIFAKFCISNFENKKVVILYWYRFLLHWTKLPQIDKFRNMYFTSFQCNRILFKWYTIKEWQRSFFMRQLQKVKVVKVKVEGWENLLNFQIDCEETTTNVKNCAGSSRIWLSLPPPWWPSPPHLWVPPITETEASSFGQKILSSWLLLWVTPRPSLEGGATNTPHNHGVSASRPSRAEVPPLVFGIIAKKKKVDGGQGDAVVVLAPASVLTSHGSPLLWPRFPVRIPPLSSSSILVLMVNCWYTLLHRFGAR